MKTNMILAALVVQTALAVLADGASENGRWVVVNEDVNTTIACTPDAKLGRESLRQHFLKDVYGPHLTHYFINPQAQSCGYDTKVGESFWTRHPDCSLAPAPSWSSKFVLLHEKGIDPYAVWTEVAREKGVSPWITMRMNDTHCVDNPRQGFATKMWIDHPEWRRGKAPHNDWSTGAFNYSVKEVADYHFALACEMMARYQPDGFECDWLRFAHHLTPGKGREEAHHLTDFMRRIRAFADELGRKRGKKMLVAARVAATIENATNLGTDAALWAREGLIDVLSVGPFWSTLDYAAEWGEWKKLIHEANPKVKVLTSCDDGVYRTSERRSFATVAEIAGAFDTAYAQGLTDGIYVFNWFVNDPTGPVSRFIRDTGATPEAVARVPRAYAVTFHDSVENGGINGTQLPVALDARREITITVGRPQPGDSVRVDAFAAKDALVPSACLRDATLNGFKPTVVADGYCEFPLQAVKSGKNAFAVGPCERKTVLCGLELTLTPPSVVKVPLKAGWKFVKADDPQIAVDHANYSNEIRKLSRILDRSDKGDFSGAPKTAWAAPGFDDSAWREVRVPHDWGVDGTYDYKLPYGDAFLDVTGIGWYRKRLRVEKVEGGVKVEGTRIPVGGKVFFECDGAMSYAMAWINGHFVGGWPYGYTRWRVDLTPHLKPDGENILAIRCHNVPHSSRWYTGGGLFRNCRLLVCREDYVVPGSVQITTPEVTAKCATVRIRYELAKSGTRERTLTIANPRLWDIDDPYLYSVDVEGNTYKYGIRTISFNSDERRFQLNGRTVPLNGVSMHHDFGVLGAAWNRTAQKRRLLKFKEAGVNAIRSSHNPPDEGLLELCDELGLLVKDEVFDEWRIIGDAGKRPFGYSNLFDDWHARDVRAWVRTDRNHPCVILYSLGNEICDLKQWAKNKTDGVATSRELARLVAEEDPSRPSCNANNDPVNFTNAYPRTLAVMGCNYMQWQYPRLKAAYPDVPFFGSETVCAMSSRGEYRFPVVTRSLRRAEFDSFYMSSYGWESCGWEKVDRGWSCPPDVQWYWMDKVGTCCGEFVWTGIDYLGGPYYGDDMRRNPHFADPQLQAKALEDVKKYGMTRAAIHSCCTGFLDQAGFRKDFFYLFQSRWRPELPMAHILPHWNWAGREGEVTPVYVFTTGDEGELFLNGKSLGRQKKRPGVWDRAYRLRWDTVRYEPGKLEVVVYRNRKVWARDTVRTAGPVAQLMIESETKTVCADGEDLAYVNVSVRDAEGTVVPKAATQVTFSVDGPGEIIATDNGDETDMSDFHSPKHAVFNGWVQALVRPKPGATGTLRVTARAEGLPPVSVSLDIAQ